MVVNLVSWRVQHGKFSSQHRSIVAALFAALVVTGCGGTDGTDGPSSSDELTYTETVVHLDGDAPPVVVSVKQFGADEAQRRQEAARAAVDGVHSIGPTAIYQDSNCSSSTSLRLYSQTNYGGSLICFDGWGTVDLDSYCALFIWGHCALGWGGIVRSMKGGGYNYNLGSCAGHLAGQTFTSLTSCEQAATTATNVRPPQGPEL